MGIDECIAAQKRRVTALKSGCKTSTLKGSACRKLRTAEATLRYLEGAKQAVKEAAAVLALRDSSDYYGGLWSVLRNLVPPEYLPEFEDDDRMDVLANFSDE